MSDEPSSSSAAAAATSIRNEGQPDQHGTAQPEADLATQQENNRKIIKKKRGELLGDLLTGLDILVYAELSTIYYMDCSFLRFLFRALIQFVVLTPKPAAFPDPPRNRPYIGALVFSNALCILFHLWLSAPSAGEATRGYLHGGLAMDFIGQEGPTSKLHLLLLDLLVVSLQFVQMSADTVHEKTKASKSSVLAAEVSSNSDTNMTTQQDLDSEEQGVRRSHDWEDIELQDLSQGHSDRATEQTNDETTENTNELSEPHALMSATTMPRSGAHIFDAFNSGQIVLADFNVPRNVAYQYRRWRTPQTDETGLQHQPQPQTLRAEFAGRVWNMRFGTDTFPRAI